MSTGTLSRKQNKREMQICTFIHCKVTSYYRIWASCGVIFCCNCIVTAFVVASGQILPALGLEQTRIEKCRCSPTYHVHVMPVKLILLGGMGTQQFGKLVFLMPSSGSYRCRFSCSEILSGPRGLWSRAARHGVMARNSAKQDISQKAWRGSQAPLSFQKLQLTYNDF